MTALQELIEILNESQKFINDNDSKEDKYYRSGLREAIEEANKLLEKEKEKQLLSNICQQIHFCCPLFKKQTFELMKKAFEAGFKKSDTVQAGLEPKETEQEINWIIMKHKNK